MVEHIAGRPTIHDEVHILEEHAHTPIEIYPTLAAGVQVVGGAGAWALGSFKEIIPAGTVGKDFDLHWLNLEAASVDEIYEFVLYAVETEIGRARFVVTRTAGNRVQLPPMKLQTPLILKNSQIQAKVSTSGGGADTCDVSLQYHTY